MEEVSKLNDFATVKNEQFYRKIKIPKKEQYESIILSASIVYIIGNMLAIFAAPVFGKFKGVIVTYDQYLRMCAISAIIVLILNLILIWFIDLRPYLEKRKGIYYRGNFTVIAKRSSLTSNYLYLAPGEAHRIKVRSDFYRSVREMDRIFLERTYLGDIITITRISSGFIDRVKRIDAQHKSSLV